MRPSNCQQFTLNMEQTAFSNVPTKTLHISGANLIHLATICSSSPRVTVAVTISAGGDLLKPMVAFKGSPTERIASRQ